MIKRGGGLSLCGSRWFGGDANHSLYAATKFAVRGFTDALRREVVGWVAVSGIYPGAVKLSLMSTVEQNERQASYSGIQGWLTGSQEMLNGHHREWW
jgi:NADP-dependent 3-hydroxy acid dehydrogenase YdfG